jgi:CheY-like chemotaxis protein
VIVGDEELARHLLREYLHQAGGVELIAECANGFEAVKAIAERKPDLVFLDVQMPKLDGFEVLELIDPSAAARPPEQKLERIVVKDGAKVHIIPLENRKVGNIQLVLSRSRSG